ncbi:MAG: hypothetical protein LBV26_08895, partial [Bacteroidales bacterium]|nr:hypothetical protein [Bacteroidales bacterium]
MGLFAKIFGKKEQDKPKEFELVDGVFVNEKGEVYGEFELKTPFNGQEFVHKLPINTTAEKLEEDYKRNQANKANPNSCEREPNEDEIKFPRKDIDGKYFPVIFDIIRRKNYSAISNGYNNIIISKKEFEELESRLNEHNKHNAILNKTVELNNKGIQLEKDGDIDNAIQVYEENILLGYPAMHSYERLMVLDRKSNDIQNEKRVIEIVIKVFSNANQQRAKQAIDNNPE